MPLTHESSPPTVIEVKNGKRHFQSKEVLNSVDLIIRAGERVRLVGENGAGKTTLLRAIAGQITFDSGSFQAFEEKVTHPVKIKEKATYLPADSPGLFERMTGLENVLLFHSIDLKTSPHKNKEIQKQKFQKTLARWQDFPPFQQALSTCSYLCSSGMKQLIALFRALSRDTNLYILDEPLKNLSVESKKFLFEELTEQFVDKTLLIASHDSTWKKDFFTRTISIAGGQLIELAD